MLSEKMQDTLNSQINAEIYSGYLYLSMQAYFESLGLPGMSNWMSCQSKEEMVHAMKIYDYINERNGRVILSAIETPQTEWSSPSEAFEAAYAHEQKVTALINGLVDIAIKESDHATNNFLQWFVSEQVEEEASVSAVIDKIKLMGDSGSGMYQIDRELGSRVFTPPQAGE
ncbi:MAG: ferritin [Fibrobacterota bacterium]